MLTQVSRRKFLLGSAALATGMAACSNGQGATTKITTPTTTAKDSLNVLLSTGPVTAGVAQRIAFVLMSDDFIDPKGDVKAAFGDEQGESSLGSVKCSVYRDSQAAPAYIVVRHEFPKAGMYWMRVTAGGKTADSPIEVVESDPAPAAGLPMPQLDTPTTDDNRGVDPICTRNPVCPLHGFTLRSALSRHRPVAVLVATPSFCQSATCGPVLDILLDQMPSYKEHIEFLHLEVYEDASAKVLAPALKSLGLQSEPVLFVTGSDATVIDRLDGVYGVAELRALLDRAK